MENSTVGFTYGDAAYHREQRCNQNCNQGRACDCKTQHEPDDLTIAYMSGFHDGKKANERDAARYRWLRDQHDQQMPIASVVWKKGSIPQSALWCNLINADDLDKHIDAALKEKS